MENRMPATPRAGSTTGMPPGAVVEAKVNQVMTNNVKRTPWGLAPLTDRHPGAVKSCKVFF
jgi:hypothetical protein